MNETTDHAKNIVRASTFRMHATIFRMSAEVLMEDLQRKGEALPLNVRALPFYYLVSHALELLLKCALLKRDIEPGNTHDLQRLLNKLISIGIPVTEEARTLINKLGDQHQKHVLRYSALRDDGQPVFTPEPPIILALLDDLLMAGRVTTYGF